MISFATCVSRKVGIHLTPQKINFAVKQFNMKPTSERIIEVTNSVRDLLLQKNAAYGDSALKPSNIFARGSAVDNIACRIDDKLMRIKNKGLNDATEDTLQDLIGYLILLKIAIEDERTQPTNNNISKHTTDGHSYLHNSSFSAPKNLEWWETPSVGRTSKIRTERSEEKASGDPMGG
jgi:hypothetical protein